jgi:metal-responsive CopG/Arc/MetJ family transcriptional regulator
MQDQNTRTTLTLPNELLEATDKAVEQGKAKSRNEFVAQALRRELAAQKRAEVDAALAEMANDPDYQAEVLKIEAEFASAQWEALELGESSE